ncbi:MAG: hypothetical protein LBQ79_03395 [Deltaproteobacteria bacterium]|jgi:hypothetical protein|nr:hypothetical protein [Deltaproteobacteria bacterium]
MLLAQVRVCLGSGRIPAGYPFARSWRGNSGGVRTAGGGIPGRLTRTGWLDWADRERGMKMKMKMKVKVKVTRLVLSKSLRRNTDDAGRTEFLETGCGGMACGFMDVLQDRMA